ncbi:type II toxin-antitoxin system HicB family antitoxin [Hanamia caeni]|jgi:predicted RNase H-like HicB family nuclease|uniref:Type II toxin-antitoxin system HicB family antitoxin n=2 Tax=Hanamia caeni TaxID=2294116 RepID=A0A3M9NJT1_9BACT|nr:type II toxin-antitoxin system HicB family antitoxin [Hanamia caeni]
MNKKNMKLTIVISKGEEFFIGTIKEIPAVLTQGETVEEARQNVLDALELYLEDMQSEEDNITKILEEDLIIS